ncbi:MAG: ubiquitin carboxyl-terminal hydrolase, partial [Gammaproteobacteria bacterium]|nr:ubiquitin carboxyl-terminal hydrolase [Gammaproteobacteria bacterium]
MEDPPKKITWAEFKTKVHNAAKQRMRYDLFEKKFGQQLDYIYQHHPQTQPSIDEIRRYARRKSPELATLMVNHGNSCYKDSVLVALFYASGAKAFFKQALLQQPFKDDATDEEWECTIDNNWRNQLREHLLYLFQHPETSSLLNPLLTQCPYVTRDGDEEHCVDFGQHEQQSAVDFMRYLFHVLKLKDNVCHHRRSTTMIHRHPDILNTKLSTLCNWWTQHASDIEVFDPSTAFQLPDQEDAQQLHKQPSDAVLLYNHRTRDKRWITSEESVAMFLCQLTFQDQGRTVDIARHIKPHVETLNVEGYRGPLLAKLHAVQVNTELSPVLIFEVSRNIGPCKVLANIDFGTQTDGQWVLDLDTNTYALTAIICHRGRQDAGHYVC